MTECHLVPGGPQEQVGVSRPRRRFSLLMKRRPSVAKEAVEEDLTPPPPPHPLRRGSCSRRRSLRLMTLPFRQVTGQGALRSKPRAKGPLPDGPPEGPSVFECECLDELSPNDPEFVRRTSMRWKRKTAAVLRHREMLERHAEGLLEGLGAPLLQHARFEWPTYPSQQPASYRRVSAPLGSYYLVAPSGPPSVPRGHALPPKGLPQRRHSASESSSRKRRRRRKSSSLMDDRVVDALRRFLKGGEERRRKDSRKEERLLKEGRRRRDGLILPPPPPPSSSTPFRRLSVRLRKSFRLHKRDDFPDTDDVASDSGLSSMSSFSSFSSFTSSSSYSSPSSPHLSPFISRVSSYSSFRSTLSSSSSFASFRSSTSSSTTFPTSSSSSTIFPSSASCQSNMSMLSEVDSTSSPLSTSSSTSSLPRLGFYEIFVGEPEIAEESAIMFPSEPRPEWHRHLRQVLHKAGQKIFKKPEHHDTHIPEDLRYQLKQIYVY